MKLIACVDQETWGIGINNGLLFHIKEDLKNFKELTSGHTVIMGKNTYVSLPLKPVKEMGVPNILLHALPNRRNVILTHDRVLPYMGNTISDNVIICNSIKELTKYCDDDAFVIGGENVYKQLIPYCTEAYITEVSCTVNKPHPDKFLCNLSKCDEWKLESQKVLVDMGDTIAYYSVYKRK